MTVTRIEVGGQHAYQVVIGTGVLAELPARVGRAARTVVVVHPKGLGEVARPVCGVLTGAGYAVHGEEVPAGEAAKTVPVAADLWSRLAGHRLTRSDAIVGVGVLGELPGLIPEQARTIVVIHSEGLGEIARPACGALKAAGLEVAAEPVPDSERAKTIDVAARLWSSLARHKLTRSDCIVGLGGGATTDLAGFVAASWLRGVPVVLVPTTLLGMADAAVGGKTGIDIAEGKNLVGAFHSPAGVLADLAVLESLPAAEYVSGLAEVIKAGFIADPAILDLVEADPAGAVVPHGQHARELVERAVRMKAEVVTADLREAGRREILNYGHTLGHAIERVERYQIRHGEAVAIGMVYAAELARLAGRLDAPAVDRHRRVLTAVGLPTTFLPGAWPALREAMAVDKKTRGARMRFVVLDGPARPAILDDPPEDLLARAYDELVAP